MRRYLGSNKVTDWPHDIAAAWELVDEMQAEPHEQAVQIWRTPALHKHWAVRVGCYVTKSAPTAPEAICRAYIAWKEGAE